MVDHVDTSTVLVVSTAYNSSCCCKHMWRLMQGCELWTSHTKRPTHEQLRRHAWRLAERLTMTRCYESSTKSSCVLCRALTCSLCCSLLCWPVMP
jgi:hypothetical protein